MARYVTTIESTLSPAEAFAYMADFSNALHWDPSVVEASRSTGGPVGEGSAFDLVVKFGGRRLAMKYELVAYDEPHSFMVESRQKSFISRDTVTVAPAGVGAHGSLRRGTGVQRRPAGLLDPIMQLLFNRTGAKAAAGMRAALNP